MKDEHHSFEYYGDYEHGEHALVLPDYRVKRLLDDITALKNQLKEAERVIEFYGDYENWSRRDTIFWESIDRNDCNDCQPVTCENIKLTGGRRARGYMNKYRSNDE